MKKKNIVLGGVIFEVGKPILHSEATWTSRRLEECYDKPSSTKIAIWNDWLKWFMQFDEWHFGVSSYNGFMFTIEGVICDNDNWYKIYITKTHNFANPMV